MVYPVSNGQRLTLPPFTKDISLGKLKASMNSGREDAARREMNSLTSKVVIKDHSISAQDGYALEARSYRPASVLDDQLIPIDVHYHGGGFFVGPLSSEDAICSRIAINTGVVAVNINYRHTPERIYPIAWNDSEDSLD